MNVLAAAALLFVYAASDLGTIINLVISARGQTVTVGPAFAFSLGTCIRDALNAGAYFFAVVVAGLSGFWPLLKLGLMLFCWHAPIERLSLGGRERLLNFLDEYGKYSLIDSWLTILALESYKVEWYSADKDVSVMVDAVPMMAFFAFVIASVLSLVMGHTTSIFAKLAKDSDLGETDHADAGDEVPERLCNYLPAGSAPGTMLGLVCTALTLIVGVFAESFAITTSGVFSSVILDTTDSTRNFSLFTLGMQVTQGAVVHNGTQMVQLIFFAFTVFIPLGLVVMLLVMWLLPLTITHQRHLLTFCRCLDAWAAFDVFGLALLVAWYEFGVMASFLVYHDNIASLCVWVRETLDSECFHIDTNLTPGYFALAAGGIVSYLVPKLSFKSAQLALEARGRNDYKLGSGSSEDDEDDDDDECTTVPKNRISWFPS
mmetsp:Transcript_99971/g.264149  ORF Transcript_99971/g.264149 Transcript_99971/m.264149 type:complete len:431 (-) Transcript_99971:51-1343(-)